MTSVYISADDGEALPTPRAGQYLTVRATGAGDPVPVRSYSLSSSPHGQQVPDQRQTRTARSGQRVRPFTTATGSLVDVAAPRGEFLLIDDTSPVLLISAGIGITPLVAMLHQLAAAHSTRDVWRIHTARDASQYPFAGEVGLLLQSLPHAHEHVFYTSPAAQPPPTGSVSRGRPTVAALAGLGLPADATAYICGPTSFMDDTVDALRQIGIAPDRIRTELFGARSAINPGVVDVRRTSPHQPPGPRGTGPQITFARSGLDGALGRSGMVPARTWWTRATCRPGGPAELVSAKEPASRHCLPGTSPMRQHHWTCRAATRLLVCCCEILSDVALDLRSNCCVLISGQRRGARWPAG